MVGALLMLMITKYWQWCCTCFYQYKQSILSLCITATETLIHNLTFKTRHHWHTVDTYFHNGAGSVSHSLLTMKATFASFMNVCNQMRLRLPEKLDEKSLMLCWLRFAGLGRQHVSLGFQYKAGQSIEKGQRRTKANMVPVTVWYVRATTNRRTG